MAFISDRRGRRWRRGVVPIAFQQNARLQRFNLDALQIRRIRTAVARLERDTQWRFVEVDEDDTAVDRVIIRRRELLDGGRSSAIGDQDCAFVGNRQFVDLQPAPSVGLVMHELAHALGVFHEHQRPDRDAFVEINWDAIRRHELLNFRRMDRSGWPVGDYDYGSIMHYGPGSLARPLRTELAVLFTDMATYLCGPRGARTSVVVFFNRVSGQFQRFLLDDQGRLLEEIETGDFNPSTTDLLHWSHGGRDVELRFDRITGDYGVFALAEDGTSGAAEQAEASLAGGNWARPALIRAGKHLYAAHFNRDSARISLHRIDLSGGQMAADSVWDLPVPDIDATQIDVVTVGGSRHFLLFDGARRGDRRARLLPLPANLRNANNIQSPDALRMDNPVQTWPVRWAACDLWPDRRNGRNETFAVGYDGAGRLERHVIRADGRLGPVFAQDDVPRNLEVVGLAPNNGEVDLFTVNVTGGLRRRCRGWRLNSETLEIQGEHRMNTVVPTGVPLSGIGQRSALSPTDVMGLNLLCDRDLHVAVLDPAAPHLSERVQCENLDYRPHKAIAFSDSNARKRLLLTGQRLSDEVHIATLRPAGAVVPPASPTTLAQRWRDLAYVRIGSRNWLYQLGQDTGEVRRYVLSASGLSPDSAPDAVGYGAFTRMAAIPVPGAPALVFVNGVDGSAMLHRLAGNGSFADAGTPQTLEPATAELAGYAWQGRAHLATLDAEGALRIRTLGDTGGLEAAAMPAVGRRWTQLAVDPFDGHMVLYRAATGDMAVYRLDGDGQPADLLGRGPDRRGMSEIAFIRAQRGTRLLTLRSPDWWTLNE